MNEGQQTTSPEKKSVEKDLKLERKILNNFIKLSPFSIHIIDKNGKSVIYNQAFIELYKSAPPKDVSLFDIPKIKEKGLADKFKEALLGKVVHIPEYWENPHEYFPHLPDNDVCVKITLFPIKDKENIVSHIVAIAEDITVQKKAERILKEKQLALESIFRAAPIGIGEVVDRVFTQVNDRFCNLVGYSREELLNKSVKMVYPSDEVYEFVGREKYDQIKKYGIGTVETQFMRKDGKILDILLSSAMHDPRDQSAGVAFTALDITDRKQAEEKIRYQANLVENVSDAIISTDNDFNIVSWNKAAELIYGWNVDEVIGKNANDVITVEYIYDKSEDVLKQFFEKGYWRGEVIQPRKDSTKIYLLSSVSLIKDINGKPIGAVAINRDITDRKMTGEKLKESEEKYKYLANELEMILDHIPGIIVYKDTENKIIRVNQFLADAHNLTKEEMEGKSSFDFYPKEQAQSYWDDDLEVVKSRQAKLNIVEPWEPEIGKRWVSTSKIPYIDEIGNVKGIIAIALDITDRMIAEQKLRESEKKYREAYNRSDLYKDLFTHDINNILQNILTSAELSKLYSSDPNSKNKLKEVWNLISEQIIRGKKLVSNVQKLSEVEEVKTPIESIEALNILSKAFKFVKESFPHRNINIEVKSFQNQFFVIANNLLVNLFENILFNAVKHNVHENIEILIRISKDRNNEKNYIKFEFLDNGVGIPDSMKPEIFSRKYKEYKKDNVPSGIGLGLLLVNRILESYNGEIRVEDIIEGDYSKGSNFIIMIPEAI